MGGCALNRDGLIISDVVFGVFVIRRVDRNLINSVFFLLWSKGTMFLLGN